MRVVSKWAPEVEDQSLTNPLPPLLFGKGAGRPAIFPSVRTITPERRRPALGPCRLCWRAPQPSQRWRGSVGLGALCPRGASSSRPWVFAVWLWRCFRTTRRGARSWSCASRTRATLSWCLDRRAGNAWPIWRKRRRGPRAWRWCSSRPSTPAQRAPSPERFHMARRRLRKTRIWPRSGRERRPTAAARRRQPPGVAAAAPLPCPHIETKRHTLETRRILWTPSKARARV